MSTGWASHELTLRHTSCTWPAVSTASDGAAIKPKSCFAVKNGPSRSLPNVRMTAVATKRGAHDAMRFQTEGTRDCHVTAERPRSRPHAVRAEIDQAQDTLSWPRFGGGANLLEGLSEMQRPGADPVKTPTHGSGPYTYCARARNSSPYIEAQAEHASAEIVRGRGA